MLRHVTWHFSFSFINMSNAYFLWIWLLTSIHIFDRNNIVYLIIFSFFITRDIEDSYLFHWDTWAFILNMTKVFAIKTLDPFPPVGIVEFLSFTILLFMLNVLHINSDIIPRSLVNLSYGFTKDLRQPKILFRHTFFLIITIFIIVNKLWRILSTTTIIWLINMSSVIKILHFEQNNIPMEITQTK